MSTVTNLYRSHSLSDRVAAEVRGHASRMGIYQKDLAKVLGIHPSQVTARMRGKVAFTLDDIETLAHLFGIEPAKLMPPPPEGVTQSNGRPDIVRSADTPDEVRRQGLEPRTRWFGAGEAIGAGETQEVSENEDHILAPVIPLIRREISRPGDWWATSSRSAGRANGPQSLHRAVSQ